MPDKFDPYREANVMETQTVWSEEFADLSASEKAEIASSLHEAAENAAQLSYVRVHTGFCRIITVTDDDVARVRG